MTYNDPLGFQSADDPAARAEHEGAVPSGKVLLDESVCWFMIGYRLKEGDPTCRDKSVPLAVETEVLAWAKENTCPHVILDMLQHANQHAAVMYMDTATQAHDLHGPESA